MANQVEIEGLFLRITADATQYERQIADVVKGIETAASSTQKAATDMVQSVVKATEQIAEHAKQQTAALQSVEKEWVQAASTAESSAARMKAAAANSGTPSAGGGN